MFIVAHNGARIWGGAERAVALLLSGLKGRGHRVLLLCSDQRVAAGAAELGVPTEILSLGGDVAIPDALKLAARLRRHRPDVFIVGTFRKLWLAALGARLARVPRIVARIGLETDTPRSRKYRFVLTRWVDTVVVNAARVRSAFLALPGYSSDRVPIVHNGVHPPRPDANTSHLRLELGIPANAPLVGSVARLARQKRIDRMIAAVAQLPDVHLVVAGEGPDRAALEGLSAEMGVAERVHFPGFRSDVGNIMSLLDLYLVTSDREGLSNSMLEAMMLGVPIVSTDVSGAMDALDPLPDGRRPGVITGFDVDGIAATIASLLGDDPQREEMRAAARDRAAERFSFEGMIDRWESVLAGRSVPPGATPLDVGGARLGRDR